MPSPTPTAALLAAIEPLAAYVARTPSGNAHADKVATAVDAVADYVEGVEAAAYQHAQEPDWQALAYQLAAAVTLPPEPPCPLIARCRALLSSPRALRTAALPLAHRQALAAVTSYDLPPYDSF